MSNCRRFLGKLSWSCSPLWCPATACYCVCLFSLHSSLPGQYFSRVPTYLLTINSPAAHHLHLIGHHLRWRLSRIPAVHLGPLLGDECVCEERQHGVWSGTCGSVNRRVCFPFPGSPGAPFLSLLYVQNRGSVNKRRLSLSPAICLDRFFFHVFCNNNSL